MHKDIVFQHSGLVELYRNKRGSCIELRGIQDDLGPPLVHYLYTGQYHTFKMQDQRISTDEKKARFFRRTARLYCIAREYRLRDLETLTRRSMQEMVGQTRSKQLLSFALDEFDRMLKDDAWFMEYLEARMRESFEADRNVFVREDFLSSVGKNAQRDRFVVRILAELLAKNASTWSESDSSVRHSPQHTPCEEDEGEFVDLP